LTIRSLFNRAHHGNGRPHILSELPDVSTAVELCRDAGLPLSITFMVQAANTGRAHTVALFNASDDTVEMVQGMLNASGLSCLIGCHFADLKRGRIDFERYLTKHNPDVVIIDISPPYQDNWAFFLTLREMKAMQGRGLVVTTTNKKRLDEVIGTDSATFEIVGKPYDLGQISAAIHSALGQHP